MFCNCVPPVFAVRGGVDVIFPGATSCQDGRTRLHYVLCRESPASQRPVSCPASSSLTSGRVPKWPNGADCKSAGNAFLGSNPSPTTTSSSPKTYGTQPVLLSGARKRPWNPLRESTWRAVHSRHLIRVCAWGTSGSIGSHIPGNCPGSVRCCREENAAGRAIGESAIRPQNRERQRRQGECAVCQCLARGGGQVRASARMPWASL